MTGRLIVLEGLDGVGKTTVARQLSVTLDAELLSTPDARLRCARSAIDATYRCSPDAAHLFYASSVVHASAAAAHTLAQGRDVIIDRYWLSTWAYAAVRKPGLRLEEVEKSLRPADFTFLLTLDETERCRRLHARGMTAADRQTLDVAVAVEVARRYHRGLHRRVAGHGVVLDITGKSGKQCAGTILATIDSVATSSSEHPAL